MGYLKHSSMDIIESDRGLTPQGRKNYDLIFCPFKYVIGDEFCLHDSCLVCHKDNPDSFHECSKKYRDTLPKSVPFCGLI